MYVNAHGHFSLLGTALVLSEIALGLASMLSLLEVEHCLGEGSIPDYQSQINSECQRDIIGSQTASAKIRSRKGNSPDHQLRSQNNC